MTSAFSGTHIQLVDPETVIAALAKALEPGGYRLRADGDWTPAANSNEFLVSPRLGNWVTVLASNDMDGREYFWAELLSQGGHHGLWLYRYEDQFFMYRLYRSGQLVDRYHSGATMSDTAARSSPRLLKPVFAAGVTLEDVDRVLRPDDEDNTSVPERFQSLARFLGVSAAALSFPLIAETGDVSLLPDAEGWRHVIFDYLGTSA